MTLPDLNKGIARILVALMLAGCAVVQAQSTFYQKMKQGIAAQEQATKLASSAEMVLNVFNDLVAIDGSTIADLKTAIVERKSCFNLVRSGSAMPEYGV